MTDRTYQLALSVRNYKSYYDGVTQLHLRKPLTVLAGPNGEGKSNLLEALLIPATEFISAAHKFRTTSLFNREVPVSNSPDVSLSYYDLIFKDHLLRSMYKAKSEVGLPRRFDPAAVVSDGKRVCELSFTISREKDGREKALGKYTSRFQTQEHSKSGIETNNLDDFDILYANSDSLLTDFMVHLFSNEIIRQWEGIPGARKKADYVQSVLSYFPEANERLIQDVSEDGFLERFLGETDRFLRQNLATGAKKEALIYLIGLVLARFNADKDNLLLVILDEIESGINVLRQKLIVDSLLHVLSEFPDKREQVKIVLSTHSPVIFSELGKEEKLADVYYVLRDDNAPSQLFNARSDEWPRAVEKKVLLELGLNVFDLPRRIIFVEGETDQLFLEHVFGDCHVTPLHGGSLPKILRQLLATMRLAWEKQYTVVVDSDKLDSIEADVDRIQERYEGDVKIDATSHGYGSLEEFLLGVDLSEAVNAKTLWTRIEDRFEDVNRSLEELGLEDLRYDIASIRAELESQKKNGVERFVGSLKGNDRLYRLFGEHWRKLLPDSSQEFISDFQTRHQLSYRK